MPSKKVYTASGTNSSLTNRTILSSSVYSLPQCLLTARSRVETISSTAKMRQNAVRDANFACAGLLAPSSLAHLVLTATEKPTGTMNANALVTWKMDTAATLYSGSGSKPASRMFASDAHHSAIIKIPGSASARNGFHSVVAALKLNPGHVSRPGSSTLNLTAYSTFRHRTTPLLHDVASAAPTYPNFNAWMNTTFAGTCITAATTPASAAGFVTLCDWRYAVRHMFHA
mmetsp:Transcript_7031/g.31777  ORF Transcript_7031/g.31777 Transcript_7031/m.31777 type:complete len:229 (-) Transcript_7031:545-1231(-)